MPQVTAMRYTNRAESSDKIYIVRIDNVLGTHPYLVIASWGRYLAPVAQSSQDKGSYRTLEEAQARVQELVAEKSGKGYRNIPVTQSVLAKIDVTRIVKRRYTKSSSQPETVQEKKKPAEQPFTKKLRLIIEE